MANMQRANIRVPANSQAVYSFFGEFLYCLESNLSFRVEGQVKGDRFPMEAGAKTRIDQDERQWLIVNENGSELVTTLIFGYGDYQLDKFVGDVTIVNASPIAVEFDSDQGVLVNNVFPIPVSWSTPQNVQFASAQNVQFATPQNVQFSTPQNVQFASAQNVQFATPQDVNVVNRTATSCPTGKVTVTTSGQSITAYDSTVEIHLYNEGAADVWIGQDQTENTDADGFVLKPDTYFKMKGTLSSISLRSSGANCDVRYMQITEDSED